MEYARLRLAESLEFESQSSRTRDNKAMHTKSGLRAVFYACKIVVRTR